VESLNEVVQCVYQVFVGDGGPTRCGVAERDGGRVHEGIEGSQVLAHRLIRIVEIGGKALLGDLTTRFLFAHKDS